MLRKMVSALLNAHREGLLVKPALNSLFRAKAIAEEAGHQVEVVIVIDRGDALTTQMIESYTEILDCEIIYTDYGDLGRARNDGIDRVSGTHVALLDADDMWGANWLLKAIESATTDSRYVAWHPEVSVYFGAERRILHHADMEEAGFVPSSLALQNMWTSLCFAPRSVFLDTPYLPARTEEGFGYEDWEWNMRTIEKGVLHKVVRGTGHMIRVKEGASLGKTAAALDLVPAPNQYLHRFIRR